MPPFLATYSSMSFACLYFVQFFVSFGVWPAVLQLGHQPPVSRCGHMSGVSTWLSSFGQPPQCLHFGGDLQCFFVCPKRWQLVHLIGFGMYVSTCIVMYPGILTCCGGVGVSKVRIHLVDGVCLPSLSLEGML